MEKTMKKLLILFLSLCLVTGLCACGNGSDTDAQTTPASGDPAATQAAAPTTTDDAEPAVPSDSASGTKWLRLAESFAYPSLDVHADYYGWYTSIYGISETLFRVADDLSIQPLLAKDYSVSDDGKTWTIQLADAKFSNGNALTADMVCRNYMRLSEVNERFAYLKDFSFGTDGDKTLTITTTEIYPTMLSDLSAPECGIMDLDGTEDFNNAPVCTGPFTVSSFEPEGTVEVVKNASYWNGSVKLDGATFYYMQDDDTKLNAMQANDIDGYTSVTAAAKEIFNLDPDTYKLTEIPATRLQFYVLNKTRLDDKVREAINLTVDCGAMAEYLGGTVSAATGPFSASAPYGKVSKPKPDTAKAKALLEEAGYTAGADGMYQKNGTPLSLNVCYYAARSLDTIAVLMQEQFKSIGVEVTLTVEEDPDATYIATGDYDIALYCMIADKSGDPYYCIDALFRKDSKWAKAAFPTDATEELINELQYETDINKRAELAKRIVQLSIDDNAFGYVGLFNKTTVMTKNVSGISENCPFDFYAIDANTDIE